KPVLMAGLAIFSVATFLCALASSVEMLIAARALQAFGGCGGVVLSRAVVRDLYSGARAGREMSLIGAVMGLAPIIAPVAGGVLHDMFGWRSTFVALCVTGVALAAIAIALLPETLKHRVAEPVTIGSMLRSFRTFLHHGSYCAHLGLAVLCFAGLFAWLSASSFVLQNLYGLSPLAFGLVFAIGSAGYTGGSIAAARVVGPLGLDRTIGIGSAAMAAGGVLMLCVVASGLRSGVVLTLAMAVYLAGMGFVLSQSIAGAMQPFPERAGAASSLLGFMQMTGSAIVGAIVGHLLGESAWPLAVTVALMGCGCLALWAATRRVRAASAP
ncbi:MAG: multidrug effflux MFS transporter, partial [Pseudolabrys sp.]|nr:multidrug effflux MFS transporter [Pseudolabrys sp.]